MELCTHENCVFEGMYSLVGHMRCENCGFQICPIVHSWVSGTHNVIFEQVGGFTDWKRQCENVGKLTKLWFENYEKSLMQSPHWTQEPTPEMIEQERKWEHEAMQHDWQCQVYADMISYILGGEPKLRSSRPLKRA